MASTDTDERRRTLLEDEEVLEPELSIEEEEAEASEEDVEQVGAFQALLQDKRKLAMGGLVFLLLIVGIYILYPKIIGIDDSLARIDEATWYWVIVAVGFNLAAFGAYVALFRG